MQLSRQSRLIAAFVALISLLFMQLAVAAYACPSRQLAQAAELAALVAQADVHRHMEDCDGADSDVSAICHAHCQPDIQSLDKPDLPAVSPFVAVALVSTVIEPVFSSQPVAARGGDIFLRRITSPPLAIQHCCFRI